MQNLPKELELGTVAAFIEFLKTLPQDAEVFTYAGHGGFISLDTGYMEFQDGVLYLDYITYDDENEERLKQGKEWTDLLKESEARKLAEKNAYAADYMPKDMERHVCDQLRNLKSFNRVLIQYEADQHFPSGNKASGGWTLNIDPGGDFGGGSEWIQCCPFCGTKLPHA